MPPSDYERFRQQADGQLLADLQMVYDAYLAKVRAYETLALTGGALPTGLRPPLALGAFAGAEPARLLSAAEPPALPPAPAAPALPPAPPTPAPAAGRRKRSAVFELRAAVLAALDQLDDTFDRDDLLQVLPCEPRRSSLHGVLQDLVYHDEVLEIAKSGRGAVLSLYRKRKPDAQSTPG